MFKKRKTETPVKPASPVGKPADAPSSQDQTPNGQAPQGNASIFPTHQTKEMPYMSRSPFGTPPHPTSPRGAATQHSGEKDERRTLVVGRGISVQGTVQDAERLVVEGTVEANMLHAKELHVRQGGFLRGEVEVEDAELAGEVDGTLTVRGNLFVRATGRLIGKTRCKRLQVEDGGQISGHLEMMTDGASSTAEKPRAIPEEREKVEAV